jgi:hypothetical protein
MDLPDLPKFAKQFAKYSRYLPNAPNVILAKMYTFAKPLFEKNDIPLAKFAQVMRNSGQCLYVMIKTINFNIIFIF